MKINFRSTARLAGRVFVYKEWPSAAGYFIVTDEHSEVVVMKTMMSRKPLPPKTVTRGDFARTFRELPRDDCMVPEAAAFFDKQRLAVWRRIERRRSNLL